MRCKDSFISLRMKIYIVTSIGIAIIGFVSVSAVAFLISSLFMLLARRDFIYLNKIFFKK